MPLGSMSVGFSITGKVLASFTSMTKAVNDDLGEISRRLGSMKRQQVDGKSLTQMTKSSKALSGELVNVDTALATVKQQSIATFGKLPAVVQKGTKQVKHLDKAIETINGRRLRMDKLVEGRAAFKASLLEKALLVGTIAAPLKVAIDFESAMADVKKVVDFESNDELKAFQSEITKLSRTIPLSAKGLADIVASGGQLGIAKDKLLGFTQTTAKMATAFDMAPSEAGEASAKLMNVFGLGVQQVGRLGDAINHLSDNTAAKASDVVNVLARVGGASKVFGLSAKQAASLGSAFLALGKPPEVAATSINALMIKLGTAEQQGAKFQSALAAIGLSSIELKANIQQNGEAAIVDFMQRLNTLDAGDKMGVLSDLFGTEYADDMALLSGGIDNYRKSIGLLADEQQFSGSMQREFKARSETTANGLRLLGNSVSTIAINVGSLLLPAFNALLSPLILVSGWLGDMAKQFPTLSTWVAGLAMGAIGLSVTLSAAAFAGSFLLGGYLKLANVVTYLIGRKAGLAVGTQVAAGATLRSGIAAKASAASHYLLGGALKVASAKSRAFGLLTKAGTALQWGLNAALSVNPLGLFVKGVLLGGALIVKYWQPIKAFFGGVFDGFTAAISPVIESLKPLLGVLSPLGDLLGWIAGGVSRVAGWFAGLLSPVQSTQTELAGFASTGELVGNMIGGAFKLALLPITTVADAIGWVSTKLGLLGGDDGEATDTTVTTPPRSRKSKLASVVGAGALATQVAMAVPAMGVPDAVPSMPSMDMPTAMASVLGAGTLATQVAMTVPAMGVPDAMPSMPSMDMPTAMAVPFPNPSIPPFSAQPAGVTQHISVHVTVNNPASSIDVERAITDALRKQGQRHGTSLSDETI